MIYKLQNGKTIKRQIKNTALEKRAKEYMAKGGRLFEMGGPTSGMNPGMNLFRAAKEKYLTDYANRGRMYSYPYSTRSLVENFILSPYNYKETERDQEFRTAQRRALFSKYYELKNTDFNPDEFIVESSYKPSKSKDPNAKYYTYKLDDEFDRSTSFLNNNGKIKFDSGEDERGKYISIYDIWDLAPFGSRIGNQMGGTPIEMYDRFYESENPRVYYRLKDFTTDEEYASGGKIHIKPENRGKLIDLHKNGGTIKLQTGKVLPIIRKMAKPISEAERLGIPKALRSNPKALEDPYYWGYQQWNSRYNTAVNSRNLQEAQRLRDLHFIIKAKDNILLKDNFPINLYHGNVVSKSRLRSMGYNPYNTKRTAVRSSGYFAVDNPEIAKTYIGPSGYMTELYGYSKNPTIYDAKGSNWNMAGVQIGPNGEKFGITTDQFVNKQLNNGHDAVIIKNVTDYGPFTQISTRDPFIDYVFKPGHVKLRDAIVWDDLHIKPIPIVKRDNFHNPDMKFKQGGTIKRQPGGPIPVVSWIKALFNRGKDKYLKSYANQGEMYGYPNNMSDLRKYISSPYIKHTTWGVPKNDYDNYRRSLFAKYFNLDSNGLDFNPDDYLEESKYRPTQSSNPNSKYYTFKGYKDAFELFNNFLGNAGTFKIGLGEDGNGRYVSLYDNWDLAPFNIGKNWAKNKNSLEFLGGSPVEIYDRIYEKDNPEAYRTYSTKYRDENGLSQLPYEKKGGIIK